jgi:hypothetical protein
MMRLLPIPSCIWLVLPRFAMAKADGPLVHRQRLKTRIGDLLLPSNIDPWPEVRDKLNRLLRGWSYCFGYGSGQGIP